MKSSNPRETRRPHILGAFVFLFLLGPTRVGGSVEGERPSTTGCHTFRLLLTEPPPVLKYSKTKRPCVRVRVRACVDQFLFPQHVTPQNLRSSEYSAVLLFFFCVFLVARKRLTRSRLRRTAWSFSRRRRRLLHRQKPWSQPPRSLTADGP